MTALTIFVFLLCTFIIVRYFSHFKEKEWKNFDNVSTLIQTLFVFVTLWITIWTISSSNQTTVDTLNELKSISTSSSSFNEGMGKVSEKLKEIPSELDQFSTTLGNLEQSLNEQQVQVKNNIKRLKNNIDELNKSVDRYQKFINNYGDQMEKIVRKTDEQLEIWKNQQKVLLDEFSRKPDLIFDISKCEKNGDTLKIKELALTNKGNITAEVIGVKIEIPTEILDTIYLEGLDFFSKYNGYTNYYYSLPINSIPSNTVKFEPTIFNIVFPKSQISKEYRVVYKLSFNSKYLDGVQPGLLTSINCK